MQLEGKVGHFAHGKKYLLAFFTFVPGVEGDEATSPSSVAENEAIEASSSSLKRLFQLHKCEGHANGKTLPTANKTPVCRSFSVSKRRGRRGNVALFCK